MNPLRVCPQCISNRFEVCAYGDRKQHTCSILWVHNCLDAQTKATTTTTRLSLQAFSLELGRIYQLTVREKVILGPATPSYHRCEWQSILD